MPKVRGQSLPWSFPYASIIGSVEISFYPYLMFGYICNIIIDVWMQAGNTDANH